VNVHLGCGTILFHDWVNIDPRPLNPPDGFDVRQGDAVNLRLPDGSVEMMFSNAVLEHIYFAQQIEALKEWGRALTPTGFAVAIGIPDFEQVAIAYLDKGPGVTGPTFDLFEAYRYTTGFPEGHLAEAGYEWKGWDTTANGDTAPPLYLAQIHKTIFDAPFLARILLHAGLNATIFRYAYQDEPHPLNLGFIAGHEYHDLDEIWAIPHIDSWINRDSLVELTPLDNSRAAAILSLVNP
jgi:SAM-dependent methyltransferase